jgi:FdhD protein
MNAATDAVERLPDPEMVLSVDDPGGTDIIRAVPCVRLAGSVGRKEEDLVPVEEALVIRINGQKAVEVTITPREIEDFVLGHLVCQGFIRAISDVRESNLGRGWAEVILEGDNSATGTATKPTKRIPAEEDMAGEGIDRLSADLRVHPGAVRQAIDAVQQSGPHTLTGGFHVCGLFVPSGSGIQPVSLCEDIGRHAALDKAVGCALRLGFDLSRCFLATTGRISSEMVTKCRRARVALIASRGATTTLAAEVAEAAGIAIVGFVRGERMNLYANDWRVIRET